MRPFAAFGAAAIALLGVAGAVQVRAADLDAIPAPAYGEPEPQFEFGTGWYLRGDAAFGIDDRPALDASGFTKTKQDWNYVLGGGVGYKFNSFLRGDVTGDYFAPNTYHPVAPGPVALGSTASINEAQVQKYDTLANLYIDLGNWYGLTPYVGGGAGVTIFDPSEHITVANKTLYGNDRVGDKTKFAWAAMAGVSYQFDQNVAVDLGYRHIDLGRFSTTLAGYSIDHRYTEDQVRIGLRYMIF